MKKYSYLFLVLALFLGCDSDSSQNDSQVPVKDGQGGSLARFTLKGDYLYTVDDFGLNVFNISNTRDPIKVNSVPIGFNIETLFSYKEYLYIGSQNGMLFTT